MFMYDVHSYAKTFSIYGRTNEKVEAGGFGPPMFPHVLGFVVRPVLVTRPNRSCWDVLQLSIGAFRGAKRTSTRHRARSSMKSM